MGESLWVERGPLDQAHGRETVEAMLQAGLLHADVRTVAGPEGLWHYTQHPVLHNGSLTWVDAPAHSGDPSIIATAQNSQAL